MSSTPTRETTRLRRLIEATLFVLVLIGVGLALDLREKSTNGLFVYMLITTGATIAFQAVVVRRPLRWMWVRGSDARVRLRSVSVIVAVALAIYPAYALVRALADGQGWNAAYLALSLVGAVGAGYAFRQATRETWRYLGLCMATAGVIGTVLFVAWALKTLTHPLSSVLFSGSDGGTFLTSLLTYVPVVFAMEEVTFRGCVDSHIHHDGDSHGILTAIWVSVLWSWWHMGCLPGTNPLNVLPGMVPIGIFFSIWWRRSRNLGVSGVTHAYIDSVRNAFGDIP